MAENNTLEKLWGDSVSQSLLTFTEAAGLCRCSINSG